MKKNEPKTPIKLWTWGTFGRSEKGSWWSEHDLEMFEKTLRLGFFGGLKGFHPNQAIRNHDSGPFQPGFPAIEERPNVLANEVRFGKLLFKESKG